MRVFGILLSAIAVQAVFDGLEGSGLLRLATNDDCARSAQRLGRH